ncbi:SusC/RagA family TonB-linked outer membrane protein [Seonamhaeicola marinus]|uniref:TonB-dependent receptor n=1 Tax=Seonamhaeicola marinus TaxID=1912246 RepID=A0A5D0HL79_9FLAO|nr:TonB-dependent receptor [Seonamhaeicola marinus]TYA71730.1 TonB-dependent receptor [Seonamhaeicola marinus]
MNKLNKKNKSPYGFILPFLFAVIFSMSLQAQNITVKGVVTGADDGLAIPGVAVVLQGTSVGAVTDFDGNYSIQANMGDVLVFSYLGMVEQKVKVTKNVMNVALESDLEDLEEVVVIGYGTQKKKEITGAVAQVKSEAIEQFVTPDVASAMQGQIAGVNITANSGEPGEQSSIQIRGITSLSGSNTPLFVVDGIPQEGDPRLSSNEIETIDVLKDAASAAVYGTRGSAGVILITTKRGKEGKMVVGFDHSYGIQRLQRDIPLMNTEQQLYFETEHFDYLTSLGLSAFNPGPNRAEWLSNDNVFTDLVLIDDAQSESYNLRVSGGNKGFTYSVSGGLLDIDGVLIGSGFKRYNGRATTTYNTENWKIDTSIGFILENRDRSTSGLITNAIRYKPYFPLIDLDSDVFLSEEGNGGVTTPLNTLAQNLKRRDNQRIDKINFSLSVTRKVTKNLDFTTRLGTNVTSTIRNIFRPRFELLDIETGASEVDPVKSGVSAFSSRLNVFSWDGFFTYKKDFGDHNINAVASASFDERTFQSFTASRNGVVSNEIEVINGASQDPLAESGINYIRKNVGFLGRLQYNYKGRYMLSGFVRRDGSSKFGQDFRWGTFPSISAAWNVSSEPFWSSIKRTVNNFKIRASRGTAGNDSFDDYVFSSSIAQELDYIFDPTDGIITLGSGVIEYANPNVKWETSVSSNIGVDLGFLKNKFTLSVDYYNTDKKDMLFPVRLPGSAGVVRGGPQDVTLNVGDMTNKGLEVAANYRANIGASKLRLGFTYTKNENEITKMADGNELIFNPNSNILGTPVTVFTVGREAAAYWLKETDGTIQTQEELDEYRLIDSNAQLGDLKYIDQLTEDTDGDGIPDAGDNVIDANDRVYSGSGLPEFELGFNMNWSYKNFDLTMNWYASVGAELINGTKADAMARGRHRDLFNMWTPNNPTSNTPFYVDRDGRHPNYNGDSDLWVENGDYLRLKLISLGYTLPKDITEKVGLSRARLYFSAQNPITITGYDGYDPEVGGNVARRGLDTARFPLSSLYSVGVNFEF